MCIDILYVYVGVCVCRCIYVDLFMSLSLSLGRYTILIYLCIYIHMYMYIDGICIYIYTCMYLQIYISKYIRSHFGSSPSRPSSDSAFFLWLALHLHWSFIAGSVCWCLPLVSNHFVALSPKPLDWVVVLVGCCYFCKYGKEVQELQPFSLWWGAEEKGA